jgi:hypothetical protein
MLMESNKNLDLFLDELLSGIVLPSDNEVRQETSNLRNSQANKGRPKTKEQIEKRRVVMPDQSGENNPFYGKSHLPETKAAISAKKKGSAAPNKGATHTDEALQKMRKPRSDAGKANMRKPRSKMLTCPHCNKTGASGNMARYHMDNCKSKP